jgi:hypothetical protein
MCVHHCRLNLQRQTVWRTPRVAVDHRCCTPATVGRCLQSFMQHCCFEVACSSSAACTQVAKIDPQLESREEEARGSCGYASRVACGMRLLQCATDTVTIGSLTNKCDLGMLLGVS